MSMPEPLASLADMRKAGMKDADILDRLALTRTQRAALLKRWRKQRARNPDLQKLPPPIKTHLDPEAVLRDYEAGFTYAQMAQRHGTRPGSIGRVLAKLRRQGRAPYRQPRRRGMQTNRQEWAALRCYTDMRMGTLGDLLDLLPQSLFHEMLSRLRKGKTAAQVLAEMLKEKHDEA